MGQEELEIKHHELTNALWEAYNTLNELYRPLQINSIKKKIDDEMNNWGYEDLEYEDRDWSDRVIETIKDVDKKRNELLKIRI
jgi:hypothetical protein